MTSNLSGAAEDRRVLMHVCCAPCAEWPLHALREEGFTVEAYFDNPNIQPSAEWEKRRATLERFAQLYGLPLHVFGHSEEQVWRQRQGMGKVAHCRICYAVRLNRTAMLARRAGFRAFTTSLLVSPYQNLSLIRSIAASAARRYGVSFLDRPFSEHFRDGQRMAREDGLYRQKYCACIYSLGETDPRFRDRYLQEFKMRLEELPTRTLFPDVGLSGAYSD